jgi:hypothetical protein
MATLPAGDREAENDCAGALAGDRYRAGKGENHIMAIIRQIQDVDLRAVFAGFFAFEDRLDRMKKVRSLSLRYSDF